MVFLGYLFTFVFGPIEYYAQGFHGSLPPKLVQILIVVSLAVSAGFCEEVICRGYFLQQFLRWSDSKAVAVGLQASLFSLAHGSNQTPMGFVHKFLLGVLFGVVAVRRHSLIPGIIAHAGVNSMIGIAAVLVVPR